MTLDLSDLTFPKQPGMTVKPPKPRGTSAPKVGPAPVAAPTKPAPGPLDELTFGNAPRAPRRSPQDWQNEIIRVAQQQGVPPAIALGVAETESSFNPEARSGAGAIGMFQLMPGTAKDLGVDPNDPEKNILGGILKLKQLYQKYGTWDRAYMAYNAGEGAVDSGRAQTFPETQSYVQKVEQAASRFLKDPRIQRAIHDPIGTARRVGGALFSPTGLRAAASGATFGIVPPPKTTTPEQGAAAQIGEMAGQTPWWILAGLLVPEAAIPSAIARTAAEGVIVGAAQGEVNVARGQGTQAQALETAAGYGAVGVAGHAILATAGKAIASLARRLNQPQEQVASAVADIIQQDTRPVTPAQKLSTALVRYSQDPYRRTTFEGAPDVNTNLIPGEVENALVPAGRGAAQRAYPVPEAAPAAAHPGIRVPAAPDPMDELRYNSDLLNRVQNLARRGGVQTGPLARIVTDEARARSVSVGTVIGEREALAGGGTPASGQGQLPSRAGGPLITPPMDPIQEIRSNPALQQRLQRVATQSGISVQEMTQRVTGAVQQYGVGVDAAITAMEERLGIVPQGTTQSLLDQIRGARASVAPREEAPAAPLAPSQGDLNLQATPPPAEPAGGPPEPPTAPPGASAAVAEPVAEPEGLPESPPAAATGRPETPSPSGAPPADTVGTEPPPTPVSNLVESGKVKGPVSAGARAATPPTVGPITVEGPLGDVLRNEKVRPGDRLIIEATYPDGTVVRQGVNTGLARTNTLADEIAARTGHPVRILKPSVDGEALVNEVRPKYAPNRPAAGPAGAPPKAAAPGRGSAPTGTAAPAPGVLQAEQLSRRASQDAPGYLATAVRKQANEGAGHAGEQVSTVNERAREADRLRTEHPRTGLKKVNASNRRVTDAQAELRQTQAWQAELRAHADALERDGIALPPLPTDIPTWNQIRYGIEQGDTAWLTEQQGRLEAAAQPIADAWRALQEAAGDAGKLPNRFNLVDMVHADPNAPPALTRYLDHLDDLTRAVNETVRQIDEKSMVLPSDLIARLRAVVGTSHVGFMAPGSDVLYDLLGSSGRGVRDVFDAALGWARDIFQPMQSLLKKVPSGQEMVTRLDGSEKQIAQRYGEIERPLREFARLPTKERLNVRDMLQRHVQPLNDRTAQWASFWRKYLSDRDAELRGYNFWTYDPTVFDNIASIRARMREGYKPTQEEQTLLNDSVAGYRKYATRSNYWPAMVKRDIDKSLENKQNITRMLTQKYARAGATDAEAEAKALVDIESIYRQRDVTYGNVEIARLSDNIPDEFREAPDKELTRYIVQVERAIALSKYFGEHAPVPDREAGQMRLMYTDAQKLIGSINQEARDRGMQMIGGNASKVGGYAERAFAEYSGEGPMNQLDMAARKSANVLNQVGIIGSMSLSALWKITQPVTNLPIRTSWRTFAGAMLDVMRSPRAEFRKAMVDGSLMNDVFYDILHSPDVIPSSRWAKSFLKINGFIPAVQFSRAVASAGGRRWARQMLGRLDRNANDSFARQEMVRLFGGPRTDQILARPKLPNGSRGLTFQETRDAGFEVSKDVEFLGRTDRYPYFWSSPWGTFASMFHRFTMQQASFLAREWTVRSPARKMQLLATTVPAWFMIGDVAQSLHADLSGKKRPLVMTELYDHFVLGKPLDVPTLELAKQILGATAGWAVLGFWGGIAQSLNNPDQAAQLAEGPVISDVTYMGAQGVSALEQERDVQEGLRSPDRRTALAALERSLVRHIPFHGLLGEDGPQTPHARYLAMHAAALAAWDRGDIGSFLNLQDQLLDSRPITAAELQEHERQKEMNQVRQDLGEGPAPLPGESNYVPTRP